MLAHGPLDKVENSASLNVPVGHAACWSPREGGGVGSELQRQELQEQPTRPRVPGVRQAERIGKLSERVLVRPAGLSPRWGCSKLDGK